MSRRPFGYWPLLATLALTAACAGVWRTLTTKRDSIKTYHARHKQAKVECLGCHEDIFDVQRIGEATLPSEKKCFECHKKERDAQDCGFCHTDPDNPRTYAKRASGIQMSHAEHLEMEEVNEDCGVCHEKLSEDRPLARTSAPMHTCLDCHEHKAEYDKATCTGCHEDLQRFPLRPLSSFTHLGDYTRNHGSQAESRGAACAQCHDQAFCSDCHAQTVAERIEVRLPERVDRNFIHWGNYLSRHPIEARAETRATCTKCHGQSFCEDCHRDSGVAPSGSGRGGLNPHESGFAQGERHGPAARRDIGSCASCHDQGAASNCVECHRVGGIGGNPHPVGFLRKHEQSEINRNPMCLVCHTSG